MTRSDDPSLRRYLLGLATPEEAEQIEDEYFTDPDAIDQLTAVENDLIDEYAAGELTSSEREAFDERYRDSPRHRLRVAVSRSIRAEAAESRAPIPIESARSAASRQWPVAVRIAVAAAAIVVIAVNAWLVRSTLPVRPGNAVAPVTQPARSSEPPPPPTPSIPRVVAIVLSPIHVRTSGGAATLSIPAGTDLVVVRLEGEGNDSDLAGVAVVRTVAGVEIWRGRAVLASGPPPDARVEIPAAVLRPDDYVIDLLGRNPDGREIERYSYFFSVRQNER